MKKSKKKWKQRFLNKQSGSASCLTNVDGHLATRGMGKQTDKRTFTLTFKDDEFIQKKKIEQGKKEEEVTYKYRIVSIDYEQSSAVFVMSRTDSHDQKQDVVFKIKEEGSKYILLGNPGTLTGSLPLKSYAAVTPTQDGTTRSDTVKKTTETVDKDGNKVIITEKVKG